MAVGQTVLRTQVDGHHAVAAHHGHATVDRHDTAIQVVHFRCARYEVHVLVDFGRHQTVTVGDLFGHFGDGQRARVAGAHQITRAQIGGLVGQYLAGHRIDQRFGRTVDVPAAGRIVLSNAAHIHLVAIAHVDAAILLRGHDVGRALQAMLIDDQRPVDEGLDGRQRNARNGGRVQLGGAHRRFQVADTLAVQAPAVHAVGIATDAAAQAQARRGARPIQIYNVARIDQVRVPDFGLVQLPDFGPPPGFLQKKSGNAPQRIALHHHVAVRGVGSQLDFIVTGLGNAGHRHHGAGGEGNAQAQRGQGPGAKLFHRHGRSLESSTHAPLPVAMRADLTCKSNSF